ncbi:MAG TPA: glycosyl hydrolase 115 family protein [Opitutaceae bacterium]|nr:glycosyl hydrolase 115 family protein [Opitutaceae bacterium]
MKSLQPILRTATVITGLLVGFVLRAAGLGLPEDLVCTSAPLDDAFPLVAADHAAPVWHDPEEFPGVVRAIGDMQADIERITGCRPLVATRRPEAASVVLVGTLGRSALIDAIAASGKLGTTDLVGKWESFVITTLDDPLPGVKRALVIAGSDRRGTIYGIYELSEQLGVSPWYWWADVPPKKRAAAYVLPGRYASGEPVVKYRGIFLNDEAPCLSGWTKEKFGGFNSQFYTKVFELLLRLRANYLWPAMWDSAFNEDDPENPRLADEYGIVMGTSHHEPMMRAHKEWTRRREQYGNGQWNYATNTEALQRFFREGIARNKRYENLVTVGMRGDGDEGMATTGSIESDTRQLERIFTDQRRILADEMHVDPATVPQLWALFTEVQKFYEHGLRPPDDVTLLWTDDNTGNLRRLPTAEERRRRGGAGIYYHLDMHGGPFAYQWINTNPFPKIAEQMNLAAEYGATRIWIANVGDLKPLELPIEFFLRLAWNPAALHKDNVAAYTRLWAERDFGPEHAAEIADLVARYAKYNGWRKPELITPETFSLLHFNEAERVEAAWLEVVARAEQLQRVLPAEQRDAFFQLVLHPAKASALVAQMNIAAGRNRLYAKQGRAGTNAEAERVRELFRQDRALSDYYNRELAGGKWNHLMDQTHLGQFDWEPPVVDAMPAVAEVLPRAESRFGVAVEGSIFAWPDHFGAASLPVFDAFQPRRSWIDVFPVGTKPIDCTVSADQPWLSITPDRETPAGRRYWVEADWTLAPVGSAAGTITITGENGSVRVKAPVVNASEAQRRAALGRFASLAGPIAVAASAAPVRTTVGDVRWEDIPDYGRVTAAVGIYPVTAASILPPAAAPTLEFPVYLPRSGDYEVTLVLGPVMDFVPDRGMRIAVALDREPPQVLDLFEDRAAETFLGTSWWTRYTRDNARLIRSKHHATTDGPHTLRVSMVDPGIVVQKIVMSDRPVPESYFGPPETAALD